MPVAPEIAARSETEPVAEEKNVPIEKPANLVESLEEPSDLVDVPDSDDEGDNDEAKYCHKNEGAKWSNDQAT